MENKEDRSELIKDIMKNIDEINLKDLKVLNEYLEIQNVQSEEYPSINKSILNINHDHLFFGLSYNHIKVVKDLDDTHAFF